MKKDFTFNDLSCACFITGTKTGHFSAVNPALFSYSTDDVYIQQPQKYNNGKQLISPNPQLYPWEAKLENGMPNALVDPNGNLSILSFEFHSVFTHSTLEGWSNGLY